MQSNATMEDVHNQRMKIILSPLPKLITTNFPSPLQEFTPFPRLPKELRPKIWHHASSIPRTIILYPPPCVKRGGEIIEGQYTILQVFQVCAESREEALRHYTYSLKMIETISHPRVPRKKGCQFTDRFLYHPFSDHFPVPCSTYHQFNFHAKDLTKAKYLDIAYSLGVILPPGDFAVELIRAFVKLGCSLVNAGFVMDIEARFEDVLCFDVYKMMAEIAEDIGKDTTGNEEREENSKKRIDMVMELKWTIKDTLEPQLESDDPHFQGC